MDKKRYFCSHCNDFVSRGTRSRHLQVISAAKETLSDSDSDCSDYNSNSVHGECAFEDNIAFESSEDYCPRNSDGKKQLNLINCFKLNLNIADYYVVINLPHSFTVQIVHLRWLKIFFKHLSLTSSTAIMLLFCAET